ncbi:hypothetical protein [Nitrosomonas ureae]|uniref:Uncharacterized protein n=1 Tax=Nitrosomonas ureae TaxID=44577 RepID=A0A1H5RZ12_9PROT|nr:hypothetical protein [Nitrosomonas ureae]SEF42761.1 hypothetical protein SAMN05216334_101283 [Nitrosomonas ureae]
MFNLISWSGIFPTSTKSWFLGEVKNRALIKQVHDARMILIKDWGNESRITELRNQLENVFIDWKLAFGKQPLNGEYKDREFEDCPPYVCAGDFILDYADLLSKLRKEAYPLLLDLDKDIGYQYVSAILVLSEAAENRVDSMIKASWEMQRYESERNARSLENELLAQQNILRHLERLELFKKGGSRRKGKIYEPKASIKIISKNIHSTKFDDVLDELKDADKCLDYYESTSNPTGVLFTEVDDDAEIIFFMKRGDKPNAQKKLNYKRLRDILTEIKKT